MTEHYRQDDVVVVAAARTIIGSTNGSLREMTAAQLGRWAADGVLTRLEKQSPRFDRGMVEHFVLGNSVGAGIGQNLPRQIAELAGFGPVETAFVVNELCGSGLEALILGGRALRSGAAEFVLAGGVEAPSASPFLITAEQLIEWQDMRVEQIQPLVVRSDQYDALCWPISGEHAIVQAERATAAWVQQQGLDAEDVKRRIDEYAITSHRRALAATEAGHFRAELALIPGTSEHDELPQAKSMTLLAKRRGTHLTPDGIFLSYHNSPSLANGAALLMLALYGTCRSFGLEPLARITGTGRSSVVADQFLLAPAPAVRALLSRTKTALQDYDLLEMNTAFGSQMLINEAELGLDMHKTNVSGDCIGLGHPVGAAGARLMTTLLHALERGASRQGLVSICLGGGNAIAMAVERLED